MRSFKFHRSSKKSALLHSEIVNGWCQFKCYKNLSSRVLLPSLPRMHHDSKTSLWGRIFCLQEKRPFSIDHGSCCGLNVRLPVPNLQNIFSNEAMNLALDCPRSLSGPSMCRACEDGSESQRECVRCLQGQNRFHLDTSACLFNNQ